MDKLRALQYFLVSAEERSFTRAARRLEVSVPAVAKLISALERQLGAALFDRSAQGLTLTANGERYLETCHPLVAQLSAADELVRGDASRPRGTLVVGAHPELLMQPWLSGFQARYPEIQLDHRTVKRPKLLEEPADIYLVHGWPEQPELILRRIAQCRGLTCAAPEYWSAHGIPQHPSDIERHACLLYRNDDGTVNDLWEYERGIEKATATARGRLVSNHRNLTIEAALAGEGVVRASDLMITVYLRSGRLVPVLQDWAMTNSPPINLLYAPHQRRNPRARLFADFVTAAFRDLEMEFGHGGTRQPFVERPYWARGSFRRASAAAQKRE